MATIEEKSTNDIITDMLIYLLDNQTDVNDVNVGSVLRTLVEATAEELNLLYQQALTIYTQNRILTATDDGLDNLGAIVGVTRAAGVKANVTVTFSRNTPATSSFSILAGTTVGTQPNVSETQLKFITLAAATFNTLISNESHLFKDGILQYKADSRFISSITSISGFVQGTDYQLTKSFDDWIVDTSNFNVIDDCEVTTGWAKSTDATAIATSATHLRGTNSLALGKSGVASDTAYYEKTQPSTDFSTDDFVMAFRVIDAAALAKLSSLKIILGNTDETNSYEYDILNQIDITGDFVKVRFNIDDASATGNPVADDVDFIRVVLQTNNSADTLSSGDILMDMIISTTTEDYRGDIVQWISTGTQPSDGANFFVTYVPLSVDINCEAELTGTAYNVTADRVNFKITSLANIDRVNNYVIGAGGQDQEADDDYRTRIQAATAGAGKATSEALRQAVLALSYVQSASINDLPLKTKTDESHIFSTGVARYKLSFEVALDNVSLVITDNPVTKTYVKDTDYELDTETNEIVWLGVDDPANGEDFLVDYQYNWLGHFEMFVAGFAAFTVAQQTEISTTIDDTKAAGTTGTWAEPTEVSQNVTGVITVNTGAGYSFAEVQPLVVAAIRNYLENLDVGEDVLIAELISVSMAVEDGNGITNVSFTVPAADVSISASQIARAGTITIT